MPHIKKITRFSLPFFIILLVSVIYFSGFQVNEKPKPPHTTWNTYGGSPDQSKYFIQNQITKQNVNKLEVAWKYATNDTRDYQNNPIIVDSVMYLLAKNNSLIAVNAKNGKEIWIHANLTGIARRGLVYWENESRTDRRILFALRNSLQAIDALTGKSILSFGKDGAADLRQGVGRNPEKISRIASATPGVIYDDVIIMGSSPGEGYLSSPGNIRAFNVKTGKLEWYFNTIPQPGEYGYETWPKDAYKYVGGANCWGEMTVDSENGIVYIPLGSPTYDYYGADRLGANLFGNCLLALDAKTGKRKWHFQTVHHDLWDYDLTSAPQLTTIKKDGKTIPVVAVATKQGFLFAFNRLTGEPLWPIEERRVPPSDMEGEEAWPTQPFPTQIPPYNRQTVTEDDVSDLILSPEEVITWKERIKNARKGLFTPPSEIETISMPGAVGGANWGNTASNPEKGLVYVLSQDYPSFYKLEKREPTNNARMQAMIENQQAVAKGTVAYASNCQACHGADVSGTGIGPSLLSMGEKLNAKYFQETVLYGVGRMPAIQHIELEDINNIVAFIKDKTTVRRPQQGGAGGPVVDVEGPVVASGGAPGEEATRVAGGFGASSSDYPEGVDVPSSRFYTGYGLGNAFVVKPPWTTITAYDLNKGIIQWQKPLGEEPQALAKGVKNTGVPAGSQRNGMIITSNGIVFSTVTNGKIYAYDADNGNILWTGQTPMGIATMPSMYELDGKIYLVINATTQQIAGWNMSDAEKEAKAKDLPQDPAYWVYALPDLK